MNLQNKNVLLGVSGGIAAYKTPDLVRKLVGHGASVRVILTDSAREFVSPLSLQAVSGNPVSHDLLDPAAEAAMGHIELAKWADIFLIAPATANTIAKLTFGLADDLLTTCVLATKAPLAIAPAMNQQMWDAPITRDNVAACAQRGIHILGPAAGEQACGDVGYGRMLEPHELADALCELVNPPATSALSGKHIVITAGPTREAIDPVRYISNHSSGKMGYALAQQAIALGASVTLVSGPVALSPPAQANIRKVNSADEMHSAVMAEITHADIFIACAAVADYKIVDQATQKIKKTQDEMTLTLTKNPDILADVAGLPAEQRPFCVGFAAETNDVEHYARGKLAKKKLDMIAANDVSNTHIGFNHNHNALTVFTPSARFELPRADKLAIAKELLTIIANHVSAN